jgi:type IV pilus assembly protein PilB
MLGELLIAAGALTDAQLQAALAEQRKWGDRLGRTLVHMGFVSEEALVQALSGQLQLPTCRPDREALPPGVTDHLGVLACERYGVMPLGVEGGVLRVATSDPSNAPLLDELATIVGLRVEPVIAPLSAIGRAIRKHYYGEPVEPTGGPSPQLRLDDLAAPTDPGGVTVELTPIDPPPAPADGAPTSRFTAAAPPAPPPPRGPATTAAAPPPPLDFDVEVAAPGELLVPQLREAVDRLEDDLAREVRALRGLVDTLIARGLITREEFLEHVRARAD